MYPVQFSTATGTCGVEKLRRGAAEGHHKDQSKWKKLSTWVNVPHRVAFFSGFVLLLALVIRPVAQLSLATIEYGSNRVAAMMESTGGEGGAKDCSVRPFYYTDTGVCPELLMNGSVPCRGTTSPHVSLASVMTKITPNGEVPCHDTHRAACEARIKMLQWFAPFQRNGSLVCMSTTWFNTTVFGILVATGSTHNVLFDPRIERFRANLNNTNARALPNLTVSTFSYTLQKDRLLTYPSVVNVSFAALGTSSSRGRVKKTTALNRTHLTFRGITAHCIQSLLAEVTEMSSRAPSSSLQEQVDTLREL